MQRVAVYVFGTSEARHAQEAACRTWAEENNYEVALVRHDVAPGQPSLHQLIAEIPDDKFDAILASEVKQYSRAMPLVEKLVRAARAKFVKVLTVDGMDLTNTGTLFMTQVEMLHHAYQLDKERAELKALLERGMRRVIADLTEEDWGALRTRLETSTQPEVMAAWKKLQEGLQDPDDPGRG